MHKPLRTLLRRTALAGAAVGLVAAPLAATPAASAAPEDEVSLTFLGINDFHGRIDGNALAFATTLEQQRALDPNTLFIAAGDNIGASGFASSIDQDNPTIDFLKAMQLDNSAVGNHEFDKGFSDLTDRVIPRFGQDDIYLGANVYLKGTTTPALPEYSEHTVDGVDIAIVGAVTEETPTLVTPTGVADLDFGDPVDAINRVAGELSDGDESNGEADVIIASYHEGAPLSEADATLDEQVAASPVFAKMVNETSPVVDAIFTGHTHEKYAYDAPIPGGTGTRPLVQSGNYGDGIAKVQLTYDAAEDTVTAYTREVVARGTTVDTSYPRVAAAKVIVDAALANAAEIGNQPVGEVTADVTTAFRQGSYVDGVYTGGSRDDRGSESTMGDLVGNMLRDTLADPDRGGADIGVTNPGGLRAELYYAGDTSTNPANTDGVVTYAEANTVLPFINNLWTTTLTGEQFVTMLEQQWQRTATGAVPSSNPYLQLGLSDNVTYTFHEVPDPAVAGAVKGVVDSVTIDGQPLDPAAEYRIGTFSFLATGGDNFRVFNDGADVKDSGLIDREGWLEYLEANSPVSPDFARQSVQVTDQPGEVTGGEDLAFSVSKLDMTSLGSPANTTLTASIDGADVGTFPVTDGAADVALTVPDGLSGAATLTLVAAPSGTTVTIPLSVATALAPSSTKAVVTPSIFGSDSLVVAHVKSKPRATGTIAVSLGGEVVGTAPVHHGVAVVRIDAGDRKSGTYTLDVAYSGDDAVAGSSTTTRLRVFNPFFKPGKKK